MGEAFTLFAARRRKFVAEVFTGKICSAASDDIIADQQLLQLVCDLG